MNKEFRLLFSKFFERIKALIFSKKFSLNLFNEKLYKDGLKTSLLNSLNNSFLFHYLYLFQNQFLYHLFFFEFANYHLRFLQNSVMFHLQDLALNLIYYLHYQNIFC